MSAPVTVMIACNQSDKPVVEMVSRWLQKTNDAYKPLETISDANQHEFMCGIVSFGCYDFLNEKKFLDHIRNLPWYTKEEVQIMLKGINDKLFRSSGMF